MKNSNHKTIFTEIPIVIVPDNFNARDAFQQRTFLPPPNPPIPPLPVAKIRELANWRIGRAI